jgi:HJR/Mrr/RecB family endonuclease
VSPIAEDVDATKVSIDRDKAPDGFLVLSKNQKFCHGRVKLGTLSHTMTIVAETIAKLEPPTLEQFGLTRKLYSYFTEHETDTLSVRFTFGCLVLVAMVFIVPVFLGSFVPASYVLLLFLLPLAGFLFGPLIYKLYFQTKMSVRRSQPAYREFVRYVSASEYYARAVAEYEPTVTAILKEEQELRRAKEEQERKAKEEAESRQREVETWWETLDGPQFEEQVTKLLTEKGYQARRTRQTRDEGVDIVVKSGEKNILVQCKAHQQPVGPAPVRDLYGTLMHHQVHHGAHEAWLVTTAPSFTEGATAFADGKPIRLLRIRDLLQLPRRNSYDDE